MSYKLIIFDMDGVLVDINSSWKWVHDHFKVQNINSVQEYLLGNIDDEELMKKDIVLWLKKRKKIHISFIEEILSKAPLVGGAEETVRVLKDNNIETAIVTSGIDILANMVKEKMGIDFVLANGLEIDNDGYLTGKPIMKVELKNKGIALKKLMHEKSLSSKECIVVGNGYNDVPMFELCGLAIAFNPIDKITIDNADILIKSKKLTSILPHILKKY